MPSLDKVREKYFVELVLELRPERGERSSHGMGSPFHAGKSMCKGSVEEIKEKPN